MTDWAEILREHGPRVWRSAYRVLNHHADAHDCYQETFLAAWEFARDHIVSDWAPFLTCLATRRAIDRLRRRLRAEARIERLDAIQEPSARAEDPLKDVHLAQLLDRVREVLVELPAKQAEVFWLSCVEELPHQQISDRLQVPPGEVRVLLHRARTRLRAVLRCGIATIGDEYE
jgi:RNA polymerase sigma-70 factor (ECF subfamily)